MKAASVFLCVAILVSCAYSYNLKSLSDGNFSTKLRASPRPSIVFFGAHWCGHCKNFKPAYINAAEKLDGLVDLYYIECTRNERTCQSQAVQGYPTIKVFNAGTDKSHAPYNGQRDARSVVQYALDRLITQRVVPLTVAKLDAFLDGPAVVVVGKVDRTPILLHHLAATYPGVTWGYVNPGRGEVVAAVGEKTGIVPATGETTIITHLDGGFEKYEGPTGKAALVKYFEGRV